MSVFEHRCYDNHERVSFYQDKASGLRAIVAIHSTRLGHALGGCRMYPYGNSYEALEDVLRLSRGMTYKAALADLPLGGGKSVIIGDPRRHKTEAMLRAMGRFIDTFGGAYVAAEDSGMNEQDLRLMAQETAHVAGIGAGQRHQGDPSPATVCGVMAGIHIAVKRRFGTSDLHGLRVAIQGLGNVGYELARQLHAAGARLWVADVASERVDRAVAHLAATAVATDAIFSLPVEVIAPCALGAVIDDPVLNKLQAGVIAGSANNQLAYDDLGRALQARNILYAPDYVINAGGLIDVWFQRLGIGCEESYEHIRTRIGNSLSEIFERSGACAVATNEVADQMARERLGCADDQVGHAA